MFSLISKEIFKAPPSTSFLSPRHSTVYITSSGSQRVGVRKKLDQAKKKIREGEGWGRGLGEGGGGTSEGRLGLGLEFLKGNEYPFKKKKGNSPSGNP